MLIGFCLLEEKLKNLIKKIFRVGAKKVHWMLLSLLCVLLLISLSSVLIYFSMGILSLMILSALVLAIILVLEKLFLVGVVKDIKNK